MIIADVAGIAEPKDLWSVFSGANLLLAITVIAAAWTLNAGLRFVLSRIAERLSRRRLAMLRAIPIITLGVWAVAGWIAIVVVLAPDTTTLTALLGAAAIAIGLAFQDGLKNLLGGLSIVFNRPFQEGDSVTIGEHYGEIRRIGLRDTQLLTRDDNLVTIPNALVSAHAVANANAGALDAQVTIDLLLPLDADADLAVAIAREAVIASPWTYLAKPVAVLLADVAGPTPFLRVRVRAYVVDARLEASLATDVTQRAKREFAARGLFGSPTNRAPAPTAPAPAA